MFEKDYFIFLLLIYFNSRKVIKYNNAIYYINYYIKFELYINIIKMFIN